MCYKIINTISTSLLVFVILSLLYWLLYSNFYLNFKLFKNSKKINSFNEMDINIRPNWNQYPIISLNQMNRILIITEARSGSTFLGDLLQQSWPTFYSFEPLINMKARNPRNDKTTVEEAVDLLHKLFNCDFVNLTDKYLVPIYWKVPYLNWNLVMRKSIDKNKIQLFNASLNRLVCQRSKHHLIKSIRFGVEDFLFLKQKLKNNETPIKLVFLVRDPRGVMSSRNRMQWCINAPNCTDVDVLCHRIRSDINVMVQLNKWSPGDLILVRYEDLALNSMTFAKRLYKKLNLEFTISVQDWIEEHTSIKDQLANPHSTVRNSKSAALSWVSRLNIDEATEIQDYCADVMHKLGYKSINFDYNDIDYSLDNLSVEQILEQQFPLAYLSPHLWI